MGPASDRLTIDVASFAKELLNTDGAEIDRASIDAFVEPWHERILNICVASNMYPVAQSV
jgi:hypothetical protein